MCCHEHPPCPSLVIPSKNPEESNCNFTEDLFSKALEYITNWPSWKGEWIILAPAAHEYVWVWFLHRDVLVLPGRRPVIAGTPLFQVGPLWTRFHLRSTIPRRVGQEDLALSLAGSMALAPWSLTLGKADLYLPLEATECFALLVCWCCQDCMEHFPGAGCGRPSNFLPGPPGSSLWFGARYPPL